MRPSHTIRFAGPGAMMLAAAFGLALAGCEGDSGPGVGTVGGAGRGARAGRAHIGGNTNAKQNLGGGGGHAWVTRGARS